MDDIFEMLKNEPPVNSIMNAKAKGESPTAFRRESFPSFSKPSLSSTTLSNKCRSISPTMTAVTDCNNATMVKDQIASDKIENENEPTETLPMELNCSPTPTKIETPTKIQTPTKAQKKLFEPIKELTIDDTKTDSKLKLFKVRIKRDNLEKLREKFANENTKYISESKKTPKKSRKISLEDSPKKSLKKSSKKSPEDSPKKSSEDSPKKSSEESPKDLPEDSLKELSEESPKKSPEKSPKKSPEDSPKKSPKELTKVSPKTTVKRKAENGDPPPSKRGRPKSVANESSKKSKNTSKGKDKSPSISPKSGAKNKSTTGFYIKLSSAPPSAKKAHASKHHSNSPKSKKQNAKSPAKKQSHKSQLPLITSRKSNSSAWTTKATKFTRTQLIKDFGKRFFTSVVKIKRCKHPLMLTFELNAGLEKYHSKNKSKNLSVSFKEQVEIIGCSDTESNYSEENPAARKSDEKPKIVTPARLQKVQNGSIVNIIEFDSSLFAGSSNSSTPLRIKPGKKSFSPLKDDSSSSARSAQLKMANEKLPPCGLRRLRDSNAIDDDDDDDDDVEYIVPIEIPEKRSSRTNSLNNTTIDSNASTKGSDDGVVVVANNVSEIEKSTDQHSSAETTTTTTTNSFRSAVEEPNSENKRPTDLENYQIGLSEKKDSEIEAKEIDSKIEETNGNGKENGKTDAHENHSKSSGKITNLSENDSDKLVLEDDSSLATSRISPTMGLQKNKPDDKLKTASDEISSDIEMTAIDEIGDDKKENANSLKNICVDKVKAITTSS